MTEREGGGKQRIGKATQIANELDALPPRELRPERPQLRLRADVPSVEVSETTRVQEILSRLDSEDTRRVLLSSPEAGVTAVVVPIDRYIDLVGTELEFEVSHSGQALLDGRIEPTELATSDVEQVDPQATWQEVGGRKPS
jgi:hypothetical protein